MNSCLKLQTATNDAATAYDEIDAVIRISANVISHCVLVADIEENIILVNEHNLGFDGKLHFLRIRPEELILHQSQEIFTQMF